MPSVQELRQDSMRLPAHDRAELALALIRSLDEASDSDVEEAWNREIEKRVAEIEAGNIEGVPAESLFAEIRSRFQ